MITIKQFQIGSVVRPGDYQIALPKEATVKSILLAFDLFFACVELDVTSPKVLRTFRIVSEGSDVTGLQFLGSAVIQTNSPPVKTIHCYLVP